MVCAAPPVTVHVIRHGAVPPVILASAIVKNTSMPPLIPVQSEKLLEARTSGVDDGATETVLVHVLLWPDSETVRETI